MKNINNTSNSPGLAGLAICLSTHVWNWFDCKEGKFVFECFKQSRWVFRKTVSNILKSTTFNFIHQYATSPQRELVSISQRRAIVSPVRLKVLLGIWTKQWMSFIRKEVVLTFSWFFRCLKCGGCIKNFISFNSKTIINEKEFCWRVWTRAFYLIFSLKQAWFPRTNKIIPYSNAWRKWRSQNKNVVP